jgi:hypothetical protein
MKKSQILILCKSICFGDKKAKTEKPLNSLEKSLIIYKKGLLSNVKKYL